MTPDQADAAVARGAAVLDECGPAGWRETVTLAIKRGELDMASCCACVLGQVFRHYGHGLDVLTPPPTGRYGFSIDHGFTVDNEDHYPLLAAAWARLLGAEVPA